MDQATLTATEEMRRGWTLILACAVGFGCGLSGIPFYTYGVFVEPLRESFGWSVALTQGGLTMSYLAIMVSMPVIGWLSDRYGSRPVVLTSLILFGFGFMLLSLLNGSALQFFAIWALLSIVGTGTLALPWSRALSGSFDRARGMALGLALLGSGVAGFAGPPLAHFLIDAYSWRIAIICLGALPLVVALPVVLIWFKEAPRLAGGTIRLFSWDASLSILRDRRCWLISVAFFMIGMGVAALIPNLMKILTSTGTSSYQAVFVISVIGLCVIIGRFLCGVLVDRFWAPGVAFVFLVLPTIACGLLSQGEVGLLAGVVAAVLIGLATGAEFDLLPYLVGRYFGLSRFGSALGVVSAFFYCGAAIGAPALGWVYDSQGSYQWGLAVVGLLFLSSAIILLFLGPYLKADPFEDPALGEKLVTTT